MTGRGYKRKYFRSRGEKILSLVPKPCVPRDSESEKEEEEVEKNYFDQPVEQFLALTDEQLENQIDNMLEYVSSVCEEEENVQIEPVIPNESSNATLIDDSIQENSNKSKQKRTEKHKIVMYRWKKVDEFSKRVTLPECCIPMENDTVGSPLNHFFELFDEEIIGNIVFESNRYFFQKTGQQGSITRDRILDLLGIEIIMGVMKMPSYRDYWCLEWGYDPIRRIMPRREYEHLRRYLHFADNANIDPSDRYYKVRPIIEAVKKTNAIVPKEKNSPSMR